MNPDNIEIEILPDGTIRSTTDRISAANHSSADQFFALLVALTGGEFKRARRGVAHGHVHEHKHVKGGE